MDSHKSFSFAVLGAGAWGTALSLYLARRGNHINLWSVEEDHIQLMQDERTNTKYLKGFPFPDTLQPIPDIKKALSDVQYILVVVPSAGFRNTLTTIKPLLNKNSRFIFATKGLDLETGELLHEIAHDILGDYPTAVLSGPSFATEVAKGLPTAVVIASKNEAYATELLKIFNSEIFRTYLSDDITGVEIGGVVKNVLAIATGISDGMQFGANARCALITRGLAEMMRLGKVLGARSETITGLSGLGDLVLTCTDDQSRNRRFGLALGAGKDIHTIESSLGHVVEGKRNAELLIGLAKKHQIELPIAEMVFAILQGKCSAKDAMKKLLERDPKKEF